MLFSCFTAICFIFKTMLLKSILTTLPALYLADTCAFCHHTDVIGRWQFNFSDYGIYSDRNVCDPEAEITTIGSKVFVFTDKNTVTNENTHSQGYWTLVYDEGFELTIDSQKWWAYFKVNHLPYDGHDPNEKCEYKCNTTMVGVVHDVHGKNWACFKAEKISDAPKTFSYSGKVLDEITARRFRIFGLWT